MAKAGTWGGYIELYVLASMLNSPIALLSDRYRPQIFRPHTTQEQPGAPIFLYYDGHVHYQALLLREGANAQNILQQLELLAHNDDNFQLSESRKKKPRKIQRRHLLKDEKQVRF